ncbi:hypothetical protein D3C86_1495990 [compost metagenome]
MGCELRQQVPNVPLNNLGMMLRTATHCHLLSKRQFVKRLILKADAVGPNRLTAQLRHDGNHDTAINATAQQSTQRNIGDHAHPDCLSKLVLEHFQGVAFANRNLVGVVDFPVPLNPEATFIVSRVMRRR